MIITRDTILHIKEMNYGELLSKSEICLRQFKSYVLWAKGAPTNHESHSRILGLARQSYESYKVYKNEHLLLAYESFVMYNELEETEIKEVA